MKTSFFVVITFFLSLPLLIGQTKAMQVVHQCYHEFGKGNIAGLLNLLAEDVVWIDPGNIGPYAGKRMGKTAVLDFFTQLNEQLDITKFESYDFYTLGEKVAVTGYVEGRARTTGTPFASDWVMTWAVNEKGKATNHHLYLDTDNIGKAVGSTKIAYIRHLHELFGEGDIPGILSLLDESITWNAKDNPLLKNGKIYKGRDGVAQFFADLKSNAVITKFEPLQMIESGNAVMVSGKFEYQLTGSSMIHETNWMFHWEFENGKPVYFHEYFDSPRPRTEIEQVGNNFLAAMDVNDYEGLKAITAAGFRIYHPNHPEPLTLEQFFEKQVLPFNAAIKGMKHTLIELSSDGKKLCMRGLASGKHADSLMGIPASGNDINVPWIALASFDTNGKIAELHVQFNQLAFLAQLGVNPMMNK